MAEKFIAEELSIGLGCRKDTSEHDLFDAVETTLKRHGLSMKNISVLSSIDIKKDEAGLIRLSEILDKPIIFFSAEKLSEVSTPNKSLFVSKITGSPSVSEAAALLNSKQKKLIIPKQKYKNITVAVAV